MKLKELKTHFADMVEEENIKTKAKVTEDFAMRQAKSNIQKLYSKVVKKPKIDEKLRQDLEAEIKNP